jgi:hypothetical protein
VGAFRTVSCGVGGVFYRLVSSSNSQVSYQLIWKMTLLLLCLLSATTTSTTAKKERGFDIVCDLTTIYGVIHDVVSRQLFDWFLLNLVDVDLHSVIFSITSPVIMIGISDSTVPSLDPSLIQSSIPSMEPISETSTVSLVDTVNDDGPTKAVISSYCHNLRLLVGIEIFILLFAVPNSKQSTIPSLKPSLISRSTTEQSSISSTVPSLDPTLISSTTTVQRLLSSTVPSLDPTLISSPIPSLEPRLISSTPTVKSRLSSPGPSLEPSFDSSSIPSLIPSPVPSLEPSLISSTNTSLKLSLISSPAPSLEKKCCLCQWNSSTKLCS